MTARASESWEPAAGRFQVTIGAVLQIPPGEVRDDLGPGTCATWTSLKHIEIVAAIEDEYGIQLSPREIRTFGTVAGLRAILTTKGLSA